MHGNMSVGSGAWRLGSTLMGVGMECRAKDELGVRRGMNLCVFGDVEPNNDRHRQRLSAGSLRGFVKSFTKDLRPKMAVIIVE